MSADRCVVCGNPTRFCPCPGGALYVEPPPPPEPPDPETIGKGETWADFTFLASWVEADYQWSAVAVIGRNADGALFIVRDGGCSCHSEWEDDPADCHPESIRNDSTGWAAAVEAINGSSADEAERTEFLRDLAAALAPEWRASLTRAPADPGAPS